MYGYTPQEIAGMTPQQQQAMLDSSADELLTFATQAEYDSWRASRGNRRT
jgi:hypothetical protein